MGDQGGVRSFEHTFKDLRAGRSSEQAITECDVVKHYGWGWIVNIYRHEERRQQDKRQYDKRQEASRKSGYDRDYPRGKR